VSAPQVTQEPPGGGRAWLVWTIGLLAYVAAVLQRTSFGVAGLEATDRYGIGPETLSLFVVVQVVVYAGMQIPSGLLLDRYGSRRLLVVGSAVMIAGQLLLAVTALLPLAIAARVLVGAGDALVFLSVIRLIPRWFPGRRVPLVTQLTGILGQAGQILSAIPLIAVLDAYGWTTAFGSAAAVGVLVLVLVVAVVTDAPRPLPAVSEPLSVRALAGRLRAVWLRPGTRLGFFTHMATQFSGTVFALLWGVPYLVTAQGMSEIAAGGMLTTFVVASIVVGPLIGEVTARRPLRRSWMVLGIIGANAAMWTIVLALPGPAPRWLLVLLVVVMATGGPGSVIGFDYARTSNPPENLGLAQGVVNQGGFLASLLVIGGIGAVVGAAGGYGYDAFRLAWTVQYPVWVLGGAAVVITRRKARRADGVNLPRLREVFVRRRGWRRIR